MAELKSNVTEKLENNTTILTRPAKPTEKELKWEADRDEEIVSGVIKNHERPGQNVTFWFKQFKGQDRKLYDLKDGERCELPLGVARHLNKNCWQAKDRFCLDSAGNPSVEVGRKLRRFSFYYSGYVDLEDLSEVGTPMVPTV